MVEILAGAIADARPVVTTPATPSETYVGELAWNRHKESCNQCRGNKGLGQLCREGLHLFANLCQAVPVEATKPQHCSNCADMQRAVTQTAREKARVIAAELLNLYLPEESPDVGRGRRFMERCESRIATALAASQPSVPDEE